MACCHRLSPLLSEGEDGRKTGIPSLCVSALSCQGKLSAKGFYLFFNISNQSRCSERLVVWLKESFSASSAGLHEICVWKLFQPPLSCICESLALMNWVLLMTSSDFPGNVAFQSLYSCMMKFLCNQQHPVNFRAAESTFSLV